MEILPLSAATINTFPPFDVNVSLILVAVAFFLFVYKHEILQYAFLFLYLLSKIAHALLQYKFENAMLSFPF